MATAESVKVDPKDPNVRRMVYNMYRGILGNYNDRANDIISAIPKDRVVEDQGITRQLESMIRQQSQISGGGNSPSIVPGPPPVSTYNDSMSPVPQAPPPPPASHGGVPPPPPPPPPLGLVHIPNMRLKTEISDVRKEPPAAIQNAMMTKDKKPFTYTPGGLDLSQIRSPRMQRRINRNAQAEDAAPADGVERQPQRPVSMPPGSGALPQLAIPVFPQAVVGNGHAPPPPPPPPQQRWSPQPPPPQPLAVPKVQPQRQVPSPTQNTGSIYIPPIQSQPQPPPQQPQPPRSQLGSLYVPPVANRPPPQEPAQYSPTPQLNKSPAPWMSRNNQTQQQVKDVPPWVNRESVQSPSSPTIHNSHAPYGQQQSPSQSQPQTRIIPIQIEGHEPPQSNTRIIPIQIEGASSPQQNPQQFNYNQPQNHYQQQQQRRPVYIHNKNNPQLVNENSTVDGRSTGPQEWMNQSDDMGSPTPVQSRSFRVLQKITDVNNPGEADVPYNSQGVPLSQLRKLQLSDDDRALMNKVKTQDSIIVPVDEENPRYRGGYIPSRVFKALDESVDEEQFLHNESDPRYRGASIPSRAFRMLQNMTEHPGEYMTQVPQGSSSTHVLTNKRPQNPEPTPSPQPYIPPSEQRVQEPRKYLGGAIPSRSFRMLQAMTAGPDPSGSEMHENWSEHVSNVEGEQVSYPHPYPSHPNDEADCYYNSNGYYYDLNRPPQTPEEQHQFWEHYSAMCAYMAEMNAAAYRYSPFPHAYAPVTPVPPPPHPLSTHYFSDSDGYSSTDEMAYYGAYFQRRPPPAPMSNYRLFRASSATPTPAPQIVITPTENLTSKSDTECEDTKDKAENIETENNVVELENSSSGSDTEVENDDDRVVTSSGLKTIRSVPDINIYKDSSSSDIGSSTSRPGSSTVKEVDGEDEEEDDEEEEEEEEGEEAEDEEHFDDDSSLHQLSVIYEESEHSSLSSKVSRRDSTVTLASEEDASSVTLDNCDDTDSDEAEAFADSDTVTVRLPIKLKFSKASDDRGMATLIVGKSEVQSSIEEVHSPTPEKSEPEGMIVEEITKNDFEPDVSVTISLKKPKANIGTEESSNAEYLDKENSACEVNKDKLERTSSPVDFWKSINSFSDESEKDAELSVRGSMSSATEEDETRPEESDGHWEDDSSSTSVQTVRTSDAPLRPGASGSDIDDSDDNLNHSCANERLNAHIVDNESESEKENHDDDDDDDDDEEDDDSSTSSSSSSDSDSESVDGDEEDEEEDKATWKVDSHNINKFKNICDKSNAHNVDELIKSVCNVKKAPEISKDDEQNDESEEDDSGVTSDMSRHISETDTDPECGVSTRKMNSYQRAATHSRLFKLLQEECAQDDDENEVPKPPEEKTLSRKDKLKLSLNEQASSKERDSLSSSSGVDSPSSPNNFEHLAKELVQSLLKRKKGRHFRKLPLAKLHDAALRILKEDADRCDAVSSASDESNLYSPVDRVHIPSGQNSNTSYTDTYYGDNYHDYCNYYNTWGYQSYGPGSINDSLGSDIVPSKAFKMLQEHTTAGQLNPHLIEGLSAKCPRVLSSKNLLVDLQRSKTPEPAPDLATAPSPSTKT